MRFSYWYIFVTVLVSIVVGVIVFFKCDLYDINGFDKALEGVLLLSSISLGFYGACLSVLASIFNTKIVKEIMGGNGYRSEFIVISILALISGFFTVLITIVYRVVLVNKTEIKASIIDLINSGWASLLILFVSFSILFTLTVFLIFLNNGKEQGENVHPGKLKNKDF